MPRNALPGLLAGALLAAPAPAQTVDELIAKSLAARGGALKLKAIQSLRMTGRMTMGPMELPMVVEMRRPGRFRSEVKVEGSLAVQAYDGSTAWGIAPPPMGTGRPERLPADAAKSMAEQADLDGPLVDHEAKGHRVELVGKKKVEGRDAYELKVTKKGGGVEYYFLDAGSFLPVRVEAKRTVEGTEIEGESTISDYREAGGVLWPYSIQNGARGRTGKQMITVLKIDINPAIDDARFRMPPSTSPKD